MHLRCLIDAAIFIHDSYLTMQSNKHTILQEAEIAYVIDPDYRLKYVVSSDGVSARQKGRGGGWHSVFI